MWFEWRFFSDRIHSCCCQEYAILKQNPMLSLEKSFLCELVHLKTSFILSENKMQNNIFYFLRMFAYVLLKKTI